MIGHLIVLTLAGLFIWELVRYLAWFEIPARLAPFAVGLICFLLALGAHYPLILSLAAAGGIAVLHAVTGISGIEPMKLRKIRLPRRKAPRHLPELPPTVGRRIPML